MRTLIASILIVVLAAVAAAHHYLYPQLKGPHRVGTELASLQEEFLTPNFDALTIESAQIISETDNTLIIRYHYQGHTEGLQITACGNVSYNEIDYFWGCRPTPLNSRSGHIDIYYQLASTAHDIECSDSVLVNLYGTNGSVFYEHRFTLQKVWHKVPSLLSWYHYRKNGCELRSKL
jgi:hypothetical protein